ncbi:agmatine deiminase family protein [Spirosoma utsteinense]|uniref:Agmatine deiminase n=1 Tax=Spirosoma utsteinense TaxID=2585773 RepID=A0ABR6W5C6_9BACT|nr:agmatine deiminase family protein [Spirosoma utsteinense]MBC3785644.1 agmatine deiminase [Spirosoma utsteinense]MBC3791795.1 agmatine deiminase [Spirosoma utsteinense]
MTKTLVLALISWLVSTLSLAQTRSTYTMPAEWEHQDAVWMGLRTEETQKQFDSVTIEMIRALAPFVRVNLILEKDTLFRDGKGWFTPLGIDTSRISIIRQDPTDYWYRDPGPVFVRNAEGQLAVVDFRYSNYGAHPDSLSERARQHDGIDRDIARRLKLPIITSSVFMEGGAMEVNGKGTLLQVESVTLQRNPHLSKEAIEQDLKRVLGVKKIIWLKKGPADDDRLGLLGDSVLYSVRGTGGHVDEFCRFANGNTMLLGWIDEGEIGTDPVKRLTHDRMVENLKILQQATDQDGKPFTIVKVPFPSINYLKRVVTESNRFYKNVKRARPNVKSGTVLYIVPSASYLNYVISNGVVLLPAYWKPGESEAGKKRDAEVLALFQKHFPGRKVVQINPIKLNYESGGMHCVTQQQPTGKAAAQPLPVLAK